MKTLRSCIAVSLISFTVLSAEVILTRIFSSYMLLGFKYCVISIIMLSAGVAGTSLYIYSRRIERIGAQRSFFIAACLSSFLLMVSIFIFCLVVNKMNSYVWAKCFQVLNPGVPALFSAKIQDFIIGNFVAQVLISGILFFFPFFFLSGALFLLYKLNYEKSGKIYFFDLLGAAAGCYFFVLLIPFLGPMKLLFLSAIFPLIAGAIVCAQKKNILIWAALAIFFAAGMVSGSIKFDRYWWGGYYLTQALRKDFVAKPVFSRSNLYSNVTVFPQNKDGYLLVIDSFSWTKIKKGAGEYKRDSFDIPLVFRDGFRNGLVIAAGGGEEVKALSKYVKDKVTGLELNEIVAGLALGRIGDLEFNNRDILLSNKVDYIVAEARSFLERQKRSGARYDYIFIGPTGSSQIGSSLLASTEEVLYTKEAFRTYLDLLAQDGILHLVRGDKYQLAAGLAYAMGEKDSRGDLLKGLLVACRGKDGKEELLFSKRGFTSSEISKIFAAEKENKIILEYLGGVFKSRKYENFERVLTDRDVDKMLFKERRQKVVTDDRPYRKYYAPSLLLKNKRGMAISDYYIKSPTYAYIGLVYFTMVLLVVSFVAIILPLKMKVGIKEVSRKASLLNSAYFSVLGLAFMLIEIPLMERLSIFLGNPIYSFVVVLSTLLISAGIGGYLSDRIMNLCNNRLPLIFIFITVVLVIFNILLDRIVYGCISYGIFPKILICMLMIFPVGILLGVPFPQGIKLVGSCDKDLIPWGMGFNALFSVVAVNISAMLTIEFGFKIILTAGIFAYFLNYFISLMLAREIRVAKAGSLFS